MFDEAKGMAQQCFISQMLTRGDSHLNAIARTFVNNGALKALKILDSGFNSVTTKSGETRVIKEVSFLDFNLSSSQSMFKFQITLLILNFD